MTKTNCNIEISLLCYFHNITHNYNANTMSMAINTSFKRKTSLNIIDWTDWITNVKSLTQQVVFIPKVIPMDSAQTYIALYIPLQRHKLSMAAW